MTGDGFEPVDAVDGLGAVWSPDFDRYAGGDTAGVRCVLCRETPCSCPKFGTPEYFAMVDRRRRR